MPGCGAQEVSVVSTPSQVLYQKAEDMVDIGAMAMRAITIACTRGKCVAIDPNGNELWRFDCPGGGYRLPSVIIDAPNIAQQRPQIVYVGSGQMVYCLVAETGKIIWQSKVSNALLGSGYITMATTWNSRIAAETFTAFNQCPSGQASAAARERARRQRQQQQN
ncbi:hypothetical protein EC973_007489 [Apophysomyces ossiformis]|uniref:Uncharacterized protein n=1 Tax=Apophysomyces ossiformis TaxID=679940 RepID=A0A8H7EPT1_9FUNG|nr:hypothetical protein EC973_007489 [Apophysomyces ossiformis]